MSDMSNIRPVSDAVQRDVLRQFYDLPPYRIIPTVPLVIDAAEQAKEDAWLARSARKRKLLLIRREQG